MMTLTWATTNDVRLQRTTNLVNAVWLDVPESEGTNTLTMPITEAKAFFRLVKGPKQGQAPAGMVAWWSGDGNARDIIGKNDGILMNGATFAPGMMGQAFSFDGTDDHVSIPDAIALKPASLTVEGWVLCKTPSPAIQVIASKTHGTGNSDSFVLMFFGDSLGVAMENLEPWLVYPFTPLPDIWYHVAFTVNDVAKRQGLYLDGILVASGSSSGSLVFDDHPVLLGAELESGSLAYFLDGLIDEVSMYNRALTAAEIKAIYDAGSAGKIKPSR